MRPHLSRLTVATPLGAYVLAAVGGLLLFLAFPRAAIWILAPMGPALLLLAVRSAGPRRGAALGLVLGLAFLLPLLKWSGVFVGPIPYLLLVLSQAVFFAALGAALATVRRIFLRPGVLALVSAGLWVAQEALRTRIPYGGFPWGRLAFAAADAPWAEAAAWGGAPLVTFIVALSGSLFAVALERLGATSKPPGQPHGAKRWGASAGSSSRQALRQDRGWLPAAALLTLAAAVATAPALLRPPASTATVRVALIQGNVPQLGLDFNAQRQAVLRNHVQRTRELADAVARGETARPDVVIWPENGSDIDPFRDPTAYALIDGAVRAVGVPVLVGAVLDGPGRYVSNSGILWDPRTGPGERYVKRHPVPFAEYIPMRRIARLVSDDVDRVRRDFAAGERVGVFEIPTAGGPVRLGDVICFEVGYDGLVGDVVRSGARVITVQTNNATFGLTPQTEQQLAISRVRAIEHRQTVLVAATSGVSAIVAPTGEVVQRADLFTPAVLVADVPVAAKMTFASRAGALPEAVLTIVGAVGLLAAAVGMLRARRRPSSRVGEHREETPARD